MRADINSDRVARTWAHLHRSLTQQTAEVSPKSTNQKDPADTAGEPAEDGATGATK